MFTGARKKTGNGLAAGCQLFYHKIYGYFCSVGIVGLILNQFEYRAPLKSLLGGVGSVALLHYCT